MTTLDLIKHKMQDKYNLLCLYRYGSCVYKYKKPNDEDFIAVVDSEESFETKVTFDGVDVKVLSRKRFQEEIIKHEVSILECIFLPDNMKWESVYFDFKLNRAILREAVSKKASVSFVKTKKKLIDGEDYIGKKSLYHSLRILMFGIQIAESGRIFDYSCANSFWNEIEQMKTWDEMKEKFQPIYNKLKSEFKIKNLND